MVSLRPVVASLLLALAGLSTASADDRSGSAMAGSIMIENGFARATVPSARTGGAYLTIVNHGTEPDRLVSIASPAAAAVSIHEMAMDGAVMRMRALDGGLAVPPGEAVVLAPGSLHLMFEGLKQPFTADRAVPVTLVFEKAGPVELSLPVLDAKAGAAKAAQTPSTADGHQH